MDTQINRTQIIDLTQRLVRCHTEAGDEKEAADLVLAEMHRLGYDRVNVDENGSVVGMIRGKHPGPTLLLDGHIDTVGVAPGVPWKQDPFGGTVIGGKLYGRGASDMKGPVAAMVLAAAAVDREELSGTLVVSASVMEEVLEGVALKTVMEATRPDFVVIGEASDLKLVHGSRGRAEILVETIGRPAHSSRPQEGINAVQAMLPVMQAIDRLALPAHKTVGQAIIALTDIISEPYPGHSVIPSRCRVTYDRRLIPGETKESVMRTLAGLPTITGATVNSSLAQGEYQTYTGRTFFVDKWFPAWLIEKDHALVQKAAKGLQLAGLPVSYDLYQFCTNAAYSAGEAGIPTIGFGPSSGSLAHVVDEYIEIDTLVKAAQGYLSIISSVLG